MKAIVAALKNKFSEIIIQKSTVPTRNEILE
jgi:hypothetical protein